jgi:hypothetical protein
LTALDTTPPVSAATTCSAAWKPARIGGLGGRGAQVRRHNDVGAPEERVLGDRLGAEDVERRAADLARVQAASRSSSTISGPRATFSTRTPSLHLASASASSQPSVSGRLGQVQGQEVGLRVDLVGGLGLLDAEIAVALGADEGVEGDDAHPEALGAMGHELADAPEAEDPERLVEQLDAENCERSHLPAMRLACAWGTLRASASSSAIVCSAAVTTLDCGRVGDDDAALGRGGDVDVVDARPRRGRRPSAGSRGR